MFKFAAAIKGPNTLFHKLPSAYRAQFYDKQIKQGQKLSKFQKGDEFRNLEAKATFKFLEDRRLNNRKKIDNSTNEQLLFGRGAIFIAGPEHPAVHSELPIREDRLFLSIVPGKKKDIAYLHNLYKEFEESLNKKGKKLIVTNSITLK